MHANKAQNPAKKRKSGFLPCGTLKVVAKPQDSMGNGKTSHLMCAQKWSNKIEGCHWLIFLKIGRQEHTIGRVSLSPLFAAQRARCTNIIKYLHLYVQQLKKLQWHGNRSRQKTSGRGRKSPNKRDTQKTQTRQKGKTTQIFCFVKGRGYFDTFWILLDTISVPLDTILIPFGWLFPCGSLAEQAAHSPLFRRMVKPRRRWDLVKSHDLKGLGMAWTQMLPLIWCDQSNHVTSFGVSNIPGNPRWQHCNTAGSNLEWDGQRCPAMADLKSFFADVGRDKHHIHRTTEIGKAQWNMTWAKEDWWVCFAVRTWTSMTCLVRVLQFIAV